MIMIIDKLIMLTLTLWAMKLQLGQWACRRRVLELEVEVEVLKLRLNQRGYRDADA